MHSPDGYGAMYGGGMMNPMMGMNPMMMGGMGGMGMMPYGGAVSGTTICALSEDVQRDENANLGPRCD
jgi:hypothetical protein